VQKTKRSFFSLFFFLQMGVYKRAAGGVVCKRTKDLFFFFSFFYRWECIRELPAASCASAAAAAGFVFVFLWGKSVYRYVARYLQNVFR
jgi:hypothetical protein